MSSHHFVTASSSTALLVCGSDIDPEILGQLLEWNPLIICLEKELQRLLAMNIRVDIVVRQSPESLPDLPYTPECWGAEALFGQLQRLFGEDRAESLAVAGSMTGKGDRLPVNRLQAIGAPVVYFTGRTRIIPVEAGTVFRKWIPEGHRFRISPPESGRLDGHITEQADSMVATADGWLRIEALIELKFQEFL